MRWMLGVCEGLADMETIQLSNGRYLSDGDCTHLYECACFDRLAKRALDLKQTRWKCRPKQHQLEHLLLDFACKLRTNPRYDANYMGQDMIRRVKVLALSCHPAHVSRHCLLKYTLQVALPYREM